MALDCLNFFQAQSIDLEILSLRERSLQTCLWKDCPPTIAELVIHARADGNVPSLPLIVRQMKKLMWRKCHLGILELAVPAPKNSVRRRAKSSIPRWRFLHSNFFISEKYRSSVHRDNTRSNYENSRVEIPKSIGVLPTEMIRESTTKILGTEIKMSVGVLSS